jgi:hypothetical protein
LEFDKSIFINCPFDDEYKPLLKTLLFVIKKLGFIPRISLERNDSSEVRLNKIKELIESSKFGIHDLSRHKSKKSDEYFRLNMPFELGLDLGCRDFNPDSKFRNKKILILEQEKYSTQKALSDLSFADCKCHNGQEEELVYEVRTWIIENGFKVKQSGSSLWDEYNIFNSKLFEQKINEKFTQKDIDLMSVAEFLGYL